MTDLIEDMTYVGDFANDTNADNRFTQQGWTKRTYGVYYFNTIYHHFKVWDGTNWVPIMNPVMAKYYNSGNQTLSVSGTWYTMVFNTGVYDNDSIFSSNIYTIPANAPGVYHIAGACAWSTNSTGLRQFAMRVNSTTIMQDSRQAIAGTASRAMVGGDFKLSGGDTIDFRIRQTSGGSLTTTGALSNTWSSVRYVGRW